MQYAIYNPQDKPVADLPVIYGFHNGGRGDWLHAQLIAADGTPLGSHICSHECFMAGDLGVLEGRREDRHETFRKHYPDGYRMDFVSYGDVEAHAGLKAAFALHDQNRPPEPEGVGNASVVIEYADTPAQNTGD